MGAKPIDRLTARRYARLAQAGAGVVLLAGVVAGALVLPEGAVPSIELPSGVPDAPASIETPPPPAVVDLSGTAERLAMIKNRPQEPVEVAAGPGAGETPAAAPPPPVRYLGPVGVGQTVLMGLIDDGGRQRFVGVGDATSGGRVRRMDPDSLTLVENDVEKTISLVGKGPETVTRTGAGRHIPVASFASANPGLPAHQPPVMTKSPLRAGGPEFDAVKMRLFNEAIEKLQGQGYEEGVLKRMAEHWAEQSAMHQLGLGSEPPPDPEKLSPEDFKEGGGKRDQ